MEAPHFLKVYEIFRKPNTKDEFVFTADTGLVYTIYASAANNNFKQLHHPSDIFYVGFYRHRKLFVFEKKTDEKIINTVLVFIFKILTDRDAIVAFSYSALGGQQDARRRRFGWLYNIYNKNKYHKMDITLKGDDVMTLIFRKDNINFVELCTMTSKDIYL